MSLTEGDAWASIDLLKRRLDEGDFWDEDFEESALDRAKKQYIRAEIKRVVDREGWPVFASVVVKDPDDGTETRVYKQETAFDRDDYVQVVSYHHERASYHESMAAGYASRGERRYGLQLSFLATSDAAGISD